MFQPWSVRIRSICCFSLSLNDCGESWAEVPEEKGKIILGKIAPLGQHDGAFYGIFQLTDVAGPRIILKRTYGLRIYAGHRLIGFFADAFQKVLRQDGNIIDASLKRRNFKLDDIQPVIEILAEGAALNFLGKIPMRGADEAKLHRNSLIAADPVEGLFLYHPKKIDLHF